MPQPTCNTKNTHTNRKIKKNTTFAQITTSKCTENKHKTMIVPFSCGFGVTVILWFCLCCPFGAIQIYKPTSYLPTNCGCLVKTQTNCVTSKRRLPGVYPRCHQQTARVRPERRERDMEECAGGTRVGAHAPPCYLTSEWQPTQQIFRLFLRNSVT